MTNMQAETLIDYAARIAAALETLAKLKQQEMDRG